VTALLTPQEVAERLQCSDRFVKDELRRKRLRGIKTGAGWRVSEVDLDIYIESHANVRTVRRTA
jgi:excisionase family DNA binding protein